MNHRCRCLISALLLMLAGACVGAEQTYTIAVIPKGTSHEYWKSIHAGAIKAQRELKGRGINVKLFWNGPLREDDRDQQIQVVENFMTRRVSGIVLAPLDSQALVAAVANATLARIPVVIIDSALNSDKYVSFVATDNYKGGELAAARMGELLGGKGRVIVLRYVLGSASNEARENGFIDTIKKKFPGIKIISSNQYAGATRELAYQAAQNLLNRFGNELDGAFAPNEPVTASLVRALRELNKAGGKVKVVGFDASEELLRDMKQGDVQGLVLQDPVLMGYRGVMTLVQDLQGEKVPRRIDTGVQLVTPENMDQPAMQQLLHPPLEQYLK
jgi:ribose transport system substrate-binding protein